MPKKIPANPIMDIGGDGYGLNWAKIARMGFQAERGSRPAYRANQSIPEAVKSLNNKALFKAIVYNRLIHFKNSS
jgi:hypothetical protein